MKIIQPEVHILAPKRVSREEFLEAIELAGRTCYKSEDRITPESAVEFVRKLIKNGHEAMIEHAPSISFRFICDRGVSHEIVRHRLFSFAQESTRYCNYGKEDEVTFIEPCFWSYVSNDEARNMQHDRWVEAMAKAEQAYLALLERGATPQEARSVLPNSLKTEIIVTGNIREWRHFFKLRTAKTAHPQMRQVANMALSYLSNPFFGIPEIFDDIIPYLGA